MCLSSNIGTWKSDLPPYLYFTVRNLLCLSSGKGDSCWPFCRPSGLLTHHLSCGTIESVPVSNTQSARDHSTGCDDLFPDYIHLVLELTLIFGRVRVFCFTFQSAETVAAYDPTTPRDVSDSEPLSSPCSSGSSPWNSGNVVYVQQFLRFRSGRV